MSTPTRNDPTSPHRGNAFYNAPFTVDNSEWRFSSRFAVNSPARSILKVRTPDPYGSPLMTSAKRRQYQVVQRRVSFAPDAHVRVFREDGRTEFNADIPSSPTHYTEQRSLMSRLSDPPSEHRKRRRDLFGSPSEYLNSPKRRATPPKVTTTRELPKRKEAMDFTDYMAGRELPTFDDILGDDDEEDGEDTERPLTSASLRSRDMDENSSSSDEQSALPSLRKYDQKDTTTTSSATRDPITTPPSSSHPRPISASSSSPSASSTTTTQRKPISRLPLAERQEDYIHSSSSSPTSRALSRSYAPVSPMNNSYSSSSRSSSSLGQARSMSRQDHSSGSDNDTSHKLSMDSEKDILNETPIRYDTALREEGIEKSPAVSKTSQSLFEWSRRLRQSFGIQQPARESYSLREFLKMADIPWKELDKMKEIKHTQLDHPLTRTISTHEKAATVASLQELEAYKNYTSSLQELVQDNQDGLQEQERKVNASHPRIISQYTHADKEEKARLQKELHKWMKMGKAKANETLLEWKLAETEEMLQTWDTFMAQADEDLRQLSDYDRFLSSKRPILQVDSTRLHHQLEDAKQHEEEYNTPESMAITSDIEKHRASLEQSQKDIQSLNTEQTQLEGYVSTLDQRKSELDSQISLLTQRLESLRRLSFTGRDLIDAKEKYEACGKIGGWEIINWTDDETELTLDNDINIVIDHSKLEARDVEAIIVRMVEQREPVYGAFSELVLGLSGLMTDVWDMKQIIRNAAVYWQYVKLIHAEVKAASQHFQTEVQALDDGVSSTSANDANERGVLCTIIPASFVSRSKVVISFRVSTADVMHFPHINMDTVTVHLEYGPMTQEETERKARELLKMHGFVGLVNTLKKLL